MKPIKLVRAAPNTIRAWTHGQFVVVLVVIALVVGGAEYQRRRLEAAIDLSSASDCSAFERDAAALDSCINRGLRTLIAETNWINPRREKEIFFLQLFIGLAIATALTMSWIHFGRQPSAAAGNG